MGDDALVDALTGPGCPMCTHVARVAPQYLDSLLYQHTTDRAYRDRFLGRLARRIEQPLEGELDVGGGDARNRHLPQTAVTGQADHRVDLGGVAVRSADEGAVPLPLCVDDHREPATDLRGGELERDALLAGHQLVELVLEELVAAPGELEAAAQLGGADEPPVVYDFGPMTTDRIVLFEQFTAGGCGFCPPVSQRLQLMGANYDRD